jgi:hypothetical protein
MGPTDDEEKNKKFQSDLLWKGNPFFLFTFFYFLTKRTFK